MGDEDYYWCYKNRETDSGLGYWDYCSLNGSHTKLGAKCQDSCRKKKGEDYYWCNTDNAGNGDYCSPDVVLGVDATKETELTRKGQICRSKCSHGGKKSAWCMIYSNSRAYSSWEYCSLKLGETISGMKCMSECGRKGEDYFWCNTQEDWDYCSPNYDAWLSQGSTFTSYPIIIMTFIIALCMNL